MNPVLLAIFASCFWGLGNVLQKHGMVTSFPKITVSQALHQIGPVLKALFTNIIWLIGLASMIGGMVSYATALGAGDITVVQPIVCLTGVWAMLIGMMFLKERFSAIEWFSMALIIAGVIFVGLVGGEKSAKIPGDAAILLFMGITVALVLASLLLKRVGIRTEFTLSIAGGFTFGLANLMGKLLTQRAILEVGEPFSLGRIEVWGSLLTDYPVLVVIVCNFFGAVFQQTAFANGRAGLVATIVTIVSTIIPIVAALTIFGETVTIFHAIGIALVIVGTGLLALKKEEEISPAPEPEQV
ncbi:MAG TPA: EamA family transporter [bacterium]|nr:EamA family transporter [bacterium]